MEPKIKLVSNWRDAPRWLSVKCMAAAGAIQSMWAFIPPDMKASIPPAGVTGLTIALLVLGVAGRVIDQGGGKQEDGNAGNDPK